jgi:hypothetical protein
MRGFVCDPLNSWSAPLRSLREHLPRTQGRKIEGAPSGFPPPFTGEVPSTECEAEGGIR